MKVQVMPEGITEDKVASFMTARVESGQLSPEDIPVRLARYGLMDPVDYSLEMEERMGSR